MLSRTSFRINSALDEVGPLSEAVHDLAAEVLDPGGAGECELGLMEALNNVIEHGGRTEPIDVHVELWPGEVRLEIVDRAKPMPEGAFQSAAQSPEDLASEETREIAEGGRGIRLILACMDEVDYVALPEGTDCAWCAAPRGASRRSSADPSVFRLGLAPAIMIARMLLGGRLREGSCVRRRGQNTWFAEFCHCN